MSNELSEFLTQLDYSPEIRSVASVREALILNRVNMNEL